MFGLHAGQYLKIVHLSLIYTLKCRSVINHYTKFYVTSYEKRDHLGKVVT